MSFAHTFDDPHTPTKKRVQYYEMVGSRAIWVDEWKAVTEQSGRVVLTEDFSECHDLADQHSDKLHELIERWWVEA